MTTAIIIISKKDLQTHTCTKGYTLAQNIKSAFLRVHTELGFLLEQEGRHLNPHQANPFLKQWYWKNNNNNNKTRYLLPVYIQIPFSNISSDTVNYMSASCYRNDNPLYI